MAKISNETIKKLADLLDKVVKLKGWMEKFDGIAFKVVLNFLNNRLGAKIPDKLNPAIDGIVDSVEKEDYKTAETQFAELMAQLIKTPFIDGTDEEITTYKAIISAIDRLVRSFFADRKKESKKS